jgi:CubicO group peptidase (beta-lactamase class C family)
LGSYFNEKFERSSRELYRTIDDYKPLVADAPLKAQPGTSWNYSNTGFLLLGAIIEKVTGKSYFDYVRENIYRPARMQNSDSFPMDEPTPNLAIGYTKERGSDGEERWKNNVFKHVVQGGPAGGGYSTVDDLLKFDVALRSHKLLKPATLERLWTPKPNSPRYGYGFGLDGTTEDRVVGHSGGFSGISAQFDMRLDRGYTLVALSNIDDGAQVVTQKALELLGWHP